MSLRYWFLVVAGCFESPGNLLTSSSSAIRVSAVYCSGFCARIKLFREILGDGISFVANVSASPIFSQ